jgi:hypothetical protein
MCRQLENKCGMKFFLGLQQSHVVVRDYCAAGRVLQRQGSGASLRSCSIILATEVSELTKSTSTIILAEPV